MCPVPLTNAKQALRFCLLYMIASPPVLRTIFCPCIGCDNCIPASDSCNRSTQRAEQVPDRHGNGCHRSQHKHRQTGKDRRKTDLHRILLLAGDLTCKFRDAARARHMVDLSKNGNRDVVKFDFTTSLFPFFIH